MDTFYIIVLSIAVCLLIFMLTFIGIKMAYNNRSTNNGTNVFPPNYSTCPDNWTADINGNCYSPTELNGNINSKNTFGYISSKQINFKDEGWGNNGTTSQCNLKNWVKTNNIPWDGITNYNGCS
jgi:hypothetical protein